MSDKEKLNEENNSEKKKNEELSSADKILNQIKQKKEESLDSEINEQSESLKESQEIKSEETVEENPEIISSADSEIIEVKNESEELSKNIDEDENDEDTNFDDDADLSPLTEQIEKEETKAELIDFSGYSKNDLLKYFNEILNSDDVLKNANNIDEIKKQYYSIIDEEEKVRKEKYLEEGGEENAYEALNDPGLQTLKELLKKFNDKKEAFKKKEYEEKKKNLEQKYAVIKEIQDLINKPETFNKTFNKFKILQKKWNSIGLVPKDDVKDLLDEYNKVVQKFYEYVEVNKELRELDFKKNFDIKTSYCEKAEELVLESNYPKAKKELQELHKKWKEAGPVSNEHKEDLWTRFQNATIKVNENYAKHIELIKEQQIKNLESKQFLVDKAEEYALAEYTNHLQWKDASSQVVQLQKLWKKIGYVPKEFNNEIYEKFKSACDKFFNRIRDYYDETEKDRDDNYQKKLDLCIQAESLKESTEWNKTSDIYKNIQAEWKKIGPVPRKYSDDIWKRFREACNYFFDRKKEFFKDKRSNEKENLKLKNELIEKIQNFEFSKNQMDDLKKLKELQKEYTSIGFVPYENKDDINNRYQQALNEKLNKLDISKEKRENLKFNENLEIIKNSPGTDRLAAKEISKIQSKIEKLKDDIKVWENNIGFFASSKESEAMINNIKEKIETAKDQVKKYKKNIDELEKLV
jgi:hypothetical protein